MDCGQVGEVSTQHGIFRVKWRIGKFFSLPDEVDSFCDSPYFYFLNMRWCLRMHPNGRIKNASEGWIELFLKRSGEGPPKRVRYTLAVGKGDGTYKAFFDSERSTRFSVEKPAWGTSRFLRRSELLIRKPQLGAVTIVCTMWSDELPSEVEEIHFSRNPQKEDVADGGAGEEDRSHLETKGRVILLKHLQDLLLDGEDHDVTLKVKDQQFKAHKNILRARSPVFAAMFAHNMRENESGDVCIDDCDPSVFGEFLKYVYVGKMENMSPSIATGVYYVADKYDFPDLKETCVEFLKESLTTEVISDVIILAMEHNEDDLLECAMEVFSRHITETLMTAEWQRFMTSNPVLSNELTIKAIKISHKNTE